MPSGLLGYEEFVCRDKSEMSWLLVGRLSGWSGKKNSMVLTCVAGVTATVEALGDLFLFAVLSSQGLLIPNAVFHIDSFSVRVEFLTYGYNLVILS